MRLRYQLCLCAVPVADQAALQGGALPGSLLVYWATSALL